MASVGVGAAQALSEGLASTAAQADASASRITEQETVIPTAVGATPSATAPFDTGHVDDHSQGVGVFGTIGDLNPGDTVQVVNATGGVLVPITCGGTFDRSTLSYEDNIAIAAVQIPA